MTLQRPKVQQVTTGRGDDPASTVAPSAAVLRAQAALMARRSELGIDDRRPTYPAQAANLRAIVTTAAGQLDPSPAVNLDHGDQLAGGAVTVYPTLAAAFLAGDLSAVGRLWLLLRAWDDRGRGFYDLNQVYKTFGGGGSAWRIGGRRRVQQLIKAGAAAGFWTMRGQGKGGRPTAIQMTGAVGVALALGVEHLAGRPVAVPVADLLGGMHTANAALFSAAVTLRMRRKGPRPVTRRTLANLTGAAVSTQRTYTRTAKIKTRSNYSISNAGDVDRRGVFPFVDYRSQQGGQPGRTYLAKHMPNSYSTPLKVKARGRMRKVNRRLNLVLSGARGYWPKVDYTRIYHDTAGQAAAGFNRACDHDHYWRHGRTSAGVGLWHVIEALSD